VLDGERRAGRLRGPLHGLPVLVKDNIASGDRMSTSAGSLVLDGVRAPRDAHVVARLRQAGAVILGKTNLSEWANMRSTRSVSGWSGRGGLTRNPYALDRSASGSSSGTAAAIAAGIAPLGVGTETDGSIVSPSSICGLVGLKPTVGRLSRDGIVPISHSQDTPGPMARSVADAALLYAAMAGRDDADGATAAAPADASSAAIVLDDDALRGARLGVARNYFTGFDELDGLIEQAIVVLRRAGAEIVDPVDLALPPYAEAELRVLLYEFKADLPKYLAAFAPNAAVQTLADAIAFNRAQREREMGWFGQELFEKAEALGGLDSKEYLDSLAECRKGARDDGIDRVLKANRLDALIAPTGGPAWLIDPVNGDHAGMSFSSPAAVAGYPHLTVPAGFVRRLPIGLSFVGPAWSEARLLGFGHAFEKATAHRRAPSYPTRSTPV
jgi:amidase